jgi:hypothetical protein
MAVEETELLGRGSAAAQLFALLCDIASTFCSSLVRSLSLAIRLISQRTTHAHAGVEFYEGKVWHERRRPVVHRFEYDVRYAVVDLDTPPPWFAASHHMSASEARSIAATAGPVEFSRLMPLRCLYSLQKMILLLIIVEMCLKNPQPFADNANKHGIRAKPFERVLRLR